MGSQMSDSETCYALVIGTENGTATLILLKIEEPIFEANLLVSCTNVEYVDLYI